MAILCRNFYTGNTVDIARSLVDCYLVRRYEGQLLVCRITETEAYVGAIDKAAHSYGYHKTARNATMFGPPGHAYIYLIYGMHCCLNFVTEPEGEPSAVLLRGLAPVHGLEALCRLRYGKAPDELTAYQRKNFLNGPGKLCKGLSLTRAENGLDATWDTLFVCESLADLGLPPEPNPIPTDIHVGKRIGIDYAQEAIDFPWRFYVTEQGEHL